MTLHIQKKIVKGRLFNAVEWRNIYHYSNDSSFGVSGGDIQNVNDQLVEMYDLFLPFTHTAFTIYEIETMLWDGEEFQPSTIQQLNLGGQNQGDIVSYQNAILLVARTVLKGVLGRKFLAGIDELYSLAGGLEQDLLVDAMIPFAAAYISPVVGDGQRQWVPCTHGAKSFAAPMVAATVGTILSTMRRRKPGYGS